MNGRLQEGETISIKMAPPGRSSMRLRPSVLVAKPEKELRWLGFLGIRGLVDGEHAFQLIQLAPIRARHRRPLKSALAGRAPSRQRYECNAISDP
jgi:hypothetical protein